MTQQEFNAKATELIKEMVNAIADKDFPRLAASIPPKLAWAGQMGADKTVENACLGFGKWLERVQRAKIHGGPLQSPMPQ